MSNSGDIHYIVGDCMNTETLEQNLITALTRLQHTALDQEFVDGKNAISPDVKPESFFSFHIGQHFFIVAASCFCEVFVETPIAALPNSPSVLRGLCNIRGLLLPVYQLHTSVGAAAPKKSIIFCIGKGDEAVGLLVDSLPTSLQLSSHERVGDGAKAAHAAIQAISSANYYSDQKLWHLVNGEHLGEQLLLLANQEQKQIFVRPARAAENLFS